jgi:hypothetical protein
MSKLIVWVLLFVTAISFVLSFLSSMLDTPSAEPLFGASTFVMVVGGLGFLIMAARQSRKDREAREERLYRQYMQAQQRYHRQ